MRIKNLILEILHTIYRHYKRQDRSFAYELAVADMLTIIAGNLITILVFMGWANKIPLDRNLPKWQELLEIGIAYYVPGYLMFRWTLKKQHVVSFEPDLDAMDRGKILLILYSIITVLAFFAAVIFVIYSRSYAPRVGAD